MEPIRKIVHARTTGPVDLQLILNPSVSVKVKLQLVQKISDALEECCRTQNYFDNMVFVLLKLIAITDPAFSPENDIFKLRKLIFQILHKICSSNDKIKNHVQSTMGACLKVIETDNEQCVIYCILIFKDLLTTFKPKFDGCFKTEISKFLKLIMDMYNSSNTQDKVLNFQKTNDLKALISTIRLTTNVSRNSVNYVFIPMGKVSFKVLKELANILKLYYILFYNVQSFKSEIIEFFPILIKFFNLDIPYKPDYRDLVVDLKYAQVRLLFFFSIFLKDNKDVIQLHCSTLPGRVICLLSCNMSSDVSSLRTELLSGFESIILIDYKCEFLPFMDKFLDETLITGRSWSLKNVLRPKAYIYIDHLITHMHNQLSLNFLVRVIHLHFSNILDPTLQPEIQINLCNMVMNVLSYVVQRQNPSITNINTIKKNDSPMIDLFYRVFRIFVIKLKQFQKFYLPQLDNSNITQECLSDNISSILAENQSRVNQTEFMYGYHSSQIPLYTTEDGKRFIKIIIPAIRTLFQFIAKIKSDKFAIEHHYKNVFINFLNHSLLSLKVFNCPNQKKEIVKEILIALSCIKPIYLKTLITCDLFIKQIYDNNLEMLMFDLALNDEALVFTFSSLIFEFVFNHLFDEDTKLYTFDLINRLQIHFKLNTNEEIINQYIFKIIQMLANSLRNLKHPIFYINVIKKMLVIVESAKYEFKENFNSVLRCLISDLIFYHTFLPNNLVLTKIAVTELCLAECLFKVILHSQIIDLFPLIVYSLQKTELTLQGLATLEKCIDILPIHFFENPALEIQNDIMNGLYCCVNSSVKSVSHSAVRLLGKFGGFNRSSIIKTDRLNTHEQYKKVSESPKIFISFEDYSNQFIGIDIIPILNSAVEILSSSDDRFNRAHSWNIIKGFLLVSFDCDVDEVTTIISNINWVTLTDLFSNNEVQYANSNTDETYIKALTGLMLCCADEYLKNDAYTYLYEFVRVIIRVALYHFSGVSNGRSLEVNPYVLIDAVTIILSNEKESVFDTGLFVTVFIIEELRIVLGDNMCHFPFIKYMFRHFSEQCYDNNWIHKRAGCFGLNVLLTNIFTENSVTTQFSQWFIHQIFTAVRAMIFTFSAYNRHLTFGALDVAQKNLSLILNLLYWGKPQNVSFTLIQDTVLKDILGYIFGPHDLLREQALKVLHIMAKQQQMTIPSILEPYYKYIKMIIPGNKLFNTYTFKNQIGIMKGHIFCSQYSIPAKKLDFSNKKHAYYFNFLCVICGKNYKIIKTIKIFKNLTSRQIHEFRVTAVQVLASCLEFCMESLKIKIFRILLNTLKSSSHELQKKTYHCLHSHCSKLSAVQMKMVNKLLLYFAKLFKNHTKVTLVNTRYIFYISKLYPSFPNVQLCTLLTDVFKYLWDDYLHNFRNGTLKNELHLTLKHILKTIYVIKKTQFVHVQKMCEIILNENIININDCNSIYPLLTKCLLKFPKDCIEFFFQEHNIKNSVWSSFFNLKIIHGKKCGYLRNVLTSNPSRFENALTLTRNDQSKTFQYEIIKIIYNLVKMDKKWITTSKSLISTLLNIWANPQYKEYYKNLATIKSTEWDEPKMLLKIVLEYFKANDNEVCILFQILPVFSYKLPLDINFFRIFLENIVIKSYTIQWKRIVFFKFVDLYQKKGINCDILGKILHYLILPCFSLCYKNGEKEKLLCTYTKSDENIIGIILSKIFTNIRVALTGCDFDGIKLSLCQLICLLIEDLLLYNENVCDIIYNAVISCTWVRCTMDINVKFHCYLILTHIMLSGNASRREKLNQGIYYELLKASFAEAQPVINYSLNLIVSSVCVKDNEINNDINTLVVCIRKIMMTESQNIPTLHHICSFLIKYHTLFYPYKQFLIRNILGSLFPIAKNNNVPEFKKTAIELSCMIINWELADDEENMKIKFPLKRKIYDASALFFDSIPLKKKSSETIDNCLNFLAMVGCQTHDDKQESRISKLAMRSATLFKNILTTESIDTKEVKLKFGWIEKLLDTFLKKENIIKENPNAHGNTNASVMNLITTFDIISFMLNVLSQNLMLEAIKPIQDHLMKFLQLAFDEEDTINNLYKPKDEKDGLTNNRLTVSQVKQYNQATLNVFSKILTTFSSIDELEKLHLFIQMIITEGLNGNCSHRLGVSLTLLQVALVNFPNYMDNNVLNTMGDIMFRFNKNNKSSLVKVKCLEILKTHVDTLPRLGKQVFIEKVVMENLDKARDSEYDIPLQVQIKCFELVITYIQDLSEATEGILLNSTLMQYIKTTTDEQIMIIILNVLTEWIKICKDEAVLFNSEIIDILKYITTLNRFPMLAEYCYKLNLEIYKNWNSRECIKYGIDCNYPIIRNDFLSFYDTLWHGDTGLYSKMYTIMSDELNYDLESSLAFYIRLLFVNISKNSKLIGNFLLLNMKYDDNKTLSISKNCSFLSKSILTSDMCSSIVQLCFIDALLAKTVWISLIPDIWSLFNNNQRNLLSKKAINFLTISKVKNSFMTAFYKAVTLCTPKINLNPFQILYIGKTYNLWYEAIEQLENVCNYHEHYKKNNAIEVLIQMYSLLHEEDVLESLFNITLKCDRTKEAFALEQQGLIKEASKIYMELLSINSQNKKVDQFKPHKKHNEFLKIRLTKCLRELNEWDALSKYILKEDDYILNIENVWRNSTDDFCSNNLQWYLCDRQNIWPSKLNWKYHFYLGMFDLKKLDNDINSTVEKHVEHSINAIINNWNALPKYICNAHIPLLQATQLIVEMNEACNVQKCWLQTPQSVNNINVLIDKWNNRKPWIGDDLNAWNDFISWRKTYYSFLKSHYINPKIFYAKSAQDQLKLIFGEIALKQNMIDVCVNTLKNVDPENVTTSNWLHKMYLEAKCVEKDKECLRKLSNITSWPLNDMVSEVFKPLLLLIRGSFQDYSGNTDIAFKYYTVAFLNPNNIDPIHAEWQSVIENNFNILTRSIQNNDTNKIPLINNILPAFNSNKILKNGWLQWAKLIKNEVHWQFINSTNIALAAMKCYVIASKLTNKTVKYNIIIAEILWLLTYDDVNCTLLRTLEKCNITFTNLWIPQILNIILEKNESIVNKIVLKIGKLCPQQMYLILNRMYLLEKMKNEEKKFSPATVEKNGFKKCITITNIKAYKIKKMMRLLRKCQLDVIHQLNHFINEISTVGVNRNEELRQNLYDCLNLCYNTAFEYKHLKVRTPEIISNFIETRIIRFITKYENTEKLKTKKYSTVLHCLPHYKYFIQKLTMDFSTNIVSTIELVINQVKKWIAFLEKMTNYPLVFNQKLPNFLIYNYDWSVIKIPTENNINDVSNSVNIHNFDANLYVKDNFGTIVKQLSIRGTNGVLYTFNISNGQDLKSEESIFQLFCITNNYLFNFKETARRYLKLFTLRTFTITPHVRMVESKSSMLSLFEIYKEITGFKWIHEDIDYWFSVFDTCVITEKKNPLNESFLSTVRQFGTDNVMKNWASLKYWVQSDYWEFRKTFIGHYSVLCFVEYAFNLIKIKPEMLNIDQNNGVVVVFYYKFLLENIYGNLDRNCNMPFRMTKSLTTFITPYRKFQMINSMTAVSLCLNNNIDDITTVLKLLLKDEFQMKYSFPQNGKKRFSNNYSIVEVVYRNLECITKKFKGLGINTAQNVIHGLVFQACNDEFLIHQLPVWRPWL